MDFRINARGFFHRVLKDRKSTRLNSSHLGISYAVFCLKKKKLDDRRIYPAVDIAASGTRREELLGDPATVQAKRDLRRGLVGLPTAQAMEPLLTQLRRTKTNAELLASS